MKIMKLLTFTLIIVILTSCGLETSNKGSTSITSTKTKVENVQIKKEHSNAWAVTGMIRNNSSSEIKGAVKIKFLNSNGDVVHNNRAKVNDGDPMKPGQAGNFEYFTDPDKFYDVTDFDVEFYER
jgi:hypothetical protein